MGAVYIRPPSRYLYQQLAVIFYLSNMWDLLMAQKSKISISDQDTYLEGPLYDTPCTSKRESASRTGLWPAACLLRNLRSTLLLESSPPNRFEKKRKSMRQTRLLHSSLEMEQVCHACHSASDHYMKVNDSFEEA